MRRFSRRARWTMVAAAGVTAMAAGAAPVLLSSARSAPGAAAAQAGSVDGGGQPDVAPGDQATPETTAPPSTTSSAPAATSSAPTTTPTAAPLAACRAGNLTLTASTDRATYRPGDVVAVTVTVTNRSDQPCSITDRGQSGNATACDPEVLLQRYDDADHYNRLLGPYFSACSPVPATLAGGENLSRQVEIPFGLTGGELRTGTWTAVVNWLTGGTDAGLSAAVTFDCPPDGCTPGPTTTSTTTSSTSTTTTSTTAPTSTTTTTSTTAPPSSTTTTSAPGSSTTTTR